MSNKPFDSVEAENLEGKEALKKLKSIAESASSCMMVTNVKSLPPSARPMALLNVGDNASLYFLSASDSEKNLDLQRDDQVCLYFQNNSKYEFLSIYGHATIHNDQATIERYWTDMAEAWFQGKNDPTITVIEVKPAQTHYWGTKNGKIISFLKMSFAALTGGTVENIGKEGELEP